MDAITQTDADAEGTADRQNLEADIACVGFGPATGGFLTTLHRAWSENPADPAFASKAVPGSPLRVLCYERADTLACGVSGVATSARGIRASFPALRPEEIPLACEIRQEHVLYLLDPIGASRRSPVTRVADLALRTLGRLAGVKDHACELPWTPRFLHKQGGLVLSIGQFNQWVASQVTSGGLVQVMAGTPVSAPLMQSYAVTGLRLAGRENSAPGVDVRARLTVVGDGPVGAVGQAIDAKIGMPTGHARREWALGMKFVIELPEDAEHCWEPGTIWHTLGYPEPEIVGFVYAHPQRLVSVGIVVPSCLHDPARTAYRYLQHYIQHPALWRYLKGGVLRSWGAKSLEQSGRHGEPFLCGDGFARIGEGSGSTNVLVGSGVDEAWTTGVQLGEAVLELLRKGEEFTREKLARTYEARRRASWVERGVRTAEDARVGFQDGLFPGLIGLALTGMTGGRISLAGEIPSPQRQIRPRREGRRERLARTTAARLATESGRAFHDALLSARGWPEIAQDGVLLVSQEDALRIAGKMEAAPGYADHVTFRDLSVCACCEEKTCAGMCSGQAITIGGNGLPRFDRGKCIHCGACLWNCARSADGVRGNIEFRAGGGGLHSDLN